MTIYPQTLRLGMSLIIAAGLSGSFALAQTTDDEVTVTESTTVAALPVKIVTETIKKVMSPTSTGKYADDPYGERKARDKKAAADSRAKQIETEKQLLDNVANPPHIKEEKKKIEQAKPKPKTRSGDDRVRTIRDRDVIDKMNEGLRMNKDPLNGA